MFTKHEGRYVCEAAIDAMAVAQERIASDEGKLVGLQITLVIETPKGIRIIGVTRERKK